MRCVWLAILVAACGGDDGLSAAPPTLTAGPVSLDTQSLSLTVGPLTIDHFLGIGESVFVDDAHFYNPRGDAAITAKDPQRATGVDGDWLVLDDGTRLRLAPCDVPDCAALDIDASGHARAEQVQISMQHPAGEPLYGTGDAAVAANVAGTVRDMQLLVDPASDSSLNETHVPVPLVLWPRSGVGMFVADDRPGAIDLAAKDTARVTATFTVPARGSYRVYLYTAAQPLDLVRRYTSLTAKPAVPPRWAFAPQQWRNEWHSSDEVRGDADAMRTRHIPGSVMWIDNPWETAYNTFVVDEARFTDPAGLIADLGARGYKVMFWSTPYVNAGGLTADDHAEGLAKHFFITTDSGGAIDIPWENGPGAMVDFTKPDAVAWWRERIARVTSLGAAGFKLDFGEELSPALGTNKLALADSAGDTQTQHGRYAGAYHDAYLGALPAGDGFLITRAGAWGEQATNTAIWPGDLESDFSTHDDVHVGGLPSAISRGLSLSLSGYPFYGSDIGGFRGFPTTEALLRWAEYASLGTIMQLGGGGQSHDPWDATLFDAGTDATYLTYARLHMRLNPLLWTLAQQAAVDGTPATRPAAFVYDCACDDAMFLLGDDVLAAPVIVQGATTREVVLPPGRWYDVARGMFAEGSVTVAAPLASLPMWYRAGSLVPMFARDADTLLPATAAGVTSYADPAYGSELRLIYTPGDPATALLHDGARATGTNTTLSVTGGTQYTIVTIDVDTRGQTGALAAPTAISVDGADLPTAADVASCAAPGCWHVTGSHLEARVFAPTAQSRAIAIR